MVNIGEKIKEQLIVKKMSVADFAKKINTDRNNAYHIFKRKSIDTELLFKISVILNFDFFKFYQPLPDNKRMEYEDFTMPDRVWFTKQFKLVQKKIDKLF
jgi:transcriptional regulator with XRE-family HTH domain